MQLCVFRVGVQSDLYCVASQACCVASGLCMQLNVLRLAVLLQACGKQPNPSAAVEMLQSAGWWRPHEQLGLIKAQRTEIFPSPVQVPICLQGLFCLFSCFDDRQTLLLYGLKGGFCLSAVLMIGRHLCCKAEIQSQCFSCTCLSRSCSYWCALATYNTETIACTMCHCLLCCPQPACHTAAMSSYKANQHAKLSKACFHVHTVC